LAAVHGIHNGFTTLHGDIHSLTHGKKVAYGTLTQLLLENRPKEELDKYITFYKELGLPTTLKEVKLDTVPYEDLLKISRLTTQDGETIHQMVVQYTTEDVANALIALDQYVTTRF
jgi:glycerol dehydrogenase